MVPLQTNACRESQREVASAELEQAVSSIVPDTPDTASAILTLPGSQDQLALPDGTAGERSHDQLESQSVPPLKAVLATGGAVTPLLVSESESQSVLLGPSARAVFAAGDAHALDSVHGSNLEPLALRCEVGCVVVRVDRWFSGR